jgi:NADH-quinone oxidoreductase subunit K
MPLLLPLLIGVLLFSIGVYGVLARRNAVLVLIGVELMLNAVNLNVLAFDAWHRDPAHSGQILTLFVITVAAAEIGLGLAIVLLVFRTRASIGVEDARDLADRDAFDELFAAEAAAEWALAEREAGDKAPAEGAPTAATATAAGAAESGDSREPSDQAAGDAEDAPAEAKR